MKIIFTFFMSVLVFTATAQWQAADFISFTAGVSSPTGTFSQADAGSFNNWNNTAGFAKSGMMVGVEGVHYLWRNLGITGALSYADHGGFNAKDAAVLSASYTDAFAVDESTVNTSGRYRSLTLLAGPNYSLPFGKFKIDVRFLAGAVKSLSTPEMTVQLEDQSNATFRQRSSSASAFGWQAGAGLFYSVSNRTGIVLRTDYFQSNGVKVDNENRPNNAGRLVTRQPMAWLSASAGLLFELP